MNFIKYAAKQFFLHSYFSVRFDVLLNLNGKFFIHLKQKSQFKCNLYEHLNGRIDKFKNAINFQGRFRGKGGGQTKEEKRLRFVFEFELGRS